MNLNPKSWVKYEVQVCGYHVISLIKNMLLSKELHISDAPVS